MLTINCLVCLPVRNLSFPADQGIVLLRGQRTAVEKHLRRKR